MENSRSRTSASSEKRFYRHNQLVTVIGALSARSLFKGEAGDLAQVGSGEASGTTLLFLGPMRTIMGGATALNHEALHYSPYGISYPQLPILPGFNGQPREALTGWYFLGNGVRIYSPALMRFLSPDRLSPFDQGGINCYAYVAGDPVNYTDPTGHVKQFKFSGPGRLLGKKTLFFKNKENGKLIGNLEIHGDEGLASFDGRTVNGKQLKSELVAKQVELDELDGFRLIACLSGDGDPSLAQQFADASGLPTIGFKGRVYPTDNRHKLIGKNSDAVNIVDYNIAHENTFKKSHPEYKHFAYDEHLFEPQKGVAQVGRKGKNIRGRHS